MTKGLKATWLFPLLFIIVLCWSVIASAAKVSAADSVNGETSGGSLMCAVGDEVNDKVENVTITHEKRDYNGASADWQVNNYQYVFLRMKGVINNKSGEIREGDYFTVKLDGKLRPNGIIDENDVSGLIPYLTYEKDGEVHMLAVPDYNRNTKTIKYFFTKDIENIAEGEINLTFADFPDLNEVKDNGNYSFTNSYAGKDYTYGYDILWSEPLSEKDSVSEKTAKSIAMITNVSIDSSGNNAVYTHRAYGEIYNADDNDEMSITWNGSAEFTDNTKLKIYGLTEQNVDSFGVDTSNLENVTDKFRFTRTGAKSVAYDAKIGDVGYRAFLVELENPFNLNDGITSHVGFKIQGGRDAGVTTFIAKEYFENARAAIVNRYPVPCREVRQLEITKVDSKDNSKTLPGAHFDLYEIKDGEMSTVPLKSLVTDSDGKIFIDEIDYDKKYALVETKAPEGYVIDNTPTEIDPEKLGKDTATVSIVVKNSPEGGTGEEPPSPSPSDPLPPEPSDKTVGNNGLELKNTTVSPSTGDRQNTVFYVYTAVISVAIAAVGLLVIKNKMNKSK